MIIMKKCWWRSAFSHAATCTTSIIVLLIIAGCCFPFTTTITTNAFTTTPTTTSHHRIPYYHRPLPPLLVIVPPETTISSRLQLQSNTNDNDDLDDNDNEKEDSTVSVVTSPCGKKRITLIGTAHLSQRSNEQVKQLINEIQPNIVMVELDETRLHRIGIPNIADIQIDNVITSDDIQLPTSLEEEETRSNNAFAKLLNPLKLLQDIIVEGFTRISRVILTGMYNDMNKDMGSDNEEGPGGEFKVAIRAAEECDNCHTLILGDRSSVETIRRAATLAMTGGDPLGVLNRLQQVNQKEMQKLEQKVRNEIILANNGDVDDNEEEGDSRSLDSKVKIAMMERLKEDNQFRNTLFEKLEQEVPEFTQAFLEERDYIMSESIRRQLHNQKDDDGKTVQEVVAVVGLAHVPGMKAYLQQQNDT